MHEWIHFQVWTILGGSYFDIVVSFLFIAYGAYSCLCYRRGLADKEAAVETDWMAIVAGYLAVTAAVFLFARGVISLFKE
jgi:hypothetical protein